MTFITKEDLGTLFKIDREAFERGLRRGLELAKEHARIDRDDPYDPPHRDVRIEWAYADHALEEELKK